MDNKWNWRPQSFKSSGKSIQLDFILRSIPIFNRALFGQVLALPSYLPSSEPRLDSVSLEGSMPMIFAYTLRSWSFF